MKTQLQTIVLFILLGAMRTASAEVPLMFSPFSEGTEWYTVQGNNGSYSHSGNLSNAYDFTAGSGATYGATLYSPVNGIVRSVRRDIVDYQNNGSANSSNNGGWGNSIVIETWGSNGQTYYVRLAHLKQYSIPSWMTPGTYITQGEQIGRIGQTGYSTEPHLHIQLQTSLTGSSIAFDFVEGDPQTGETIVSELEEDKYIIDDDGRANLGSPIRNVSNGTSGSFSTYSWFTGTHGDDYRGSTSSGARYYWWFDLHGPSDTFDIYANCWALSNRDPAASYSITGSGVSISRTVDQRRMHDYAYLGRANLRNGYRYTARVARSSSGRLCADSIVIYQR